MTELRQAVAGDLAWIRGLEDAFARQGLVGCDRDEIHTARMASSESRYLIVEHDGERAGFVILCGLGSVNRSIELKRIVVARPGKGIGRQALRLILTVAFGDLAAHRLWLDVYPENERARRAYRAVGFVEEGTMRECIWSGDRFRSLIVMSILKTSDRLV